jgi:hypothetical protein
MKNCSCPLTNATSSLIAETPKFHYSIAQCVKTKGSQRNTTKKKYAKHNESSLSFCLPHPNKHPNNTHKSCSNKTLFFAFGSPYFISTNDIL